MALAGGIRVPPGTCSSFKYLNIQCLPSKFAGILTVYVKSKVGSFVYWGLFQINNIFLILPKHLLFNALAENISLTLISVLERFSLPH